MHLVPLEFVNVANRRQTAVMGRAWLTRYSKVFFSRLSGSVIEWQALASDVGRLSARQQRGISRD